MEKFDAFLLVLKQQSGFLSSNRDLLSLSTSLSRMQNLKHLKIGNDPEYRNYRDEFFLRRFLSPAKRRVDTPYILKHILRPLLLSPVQLQTLHLRDIKIWDFANLNNEDSVTWALTCRDVSDALFGYQDYDSEDWRGTSEEYEACCRGYDRLLEIVAGMQKLRELDIDLQCNFCKDGVTAQTLPRQHILPQGKRLPNLVVLKVTGLIATENAFVHFFESHKGTLRHLNMVGPAISGMSSWLSLLPQIRQILSLSTAKLSYYPQSVDNTTVHKMWKLSDYDGMEEAMEAFLTGADDVLPITHDNSIDKSHRRYRMPRRYDMMCPIGDPRR